MVTVKKRVVAGAAAAAMVVLAGCGSSDTTSTGPTSSPEPQEIFGPEPRDLFKPGADAFVNTMNAVSEYEEAGGQSPYDQPATADMKKYMTEAGISRYISAESGDWQKNAEGNRTVGYKLIEPYKLVSYTGVELRRNTQLTPWTMNVVVCTVRKDESYEIAPDGERATYIWPGEPTVAYASLKSPDEGKTWLFDEANYQVKIEDLTVTPREPFTCGDKTFTPSSGSSSNVS